MTPFGSILCFHGISSREAPSANVANLPLDQITSLLKTVRSFAEIVPLRTLIARHTSSKSTGGLAALTFDDAYASLDGAFLEAVRRTQTPITLFATTSSDLPKTGFWWDRVDEAFSRADPERWRRFEDSIGLPKAFRDSQPADMGRLRPLRQWLLAVFKGRWSPAVEMELGRLEDELGFRSTQRPLSLAELAEVARDPLIDVAPHTITHPVLPLLSSDEIEREVAGCYMTLRECLDRVSPVLAFPFGLFDVRTAQIARASGMQACVALGDHTVRWSARLPAGVLPRLSISTGMSPWRMRLHLLGAIEQLNEALGRSQPDLPCLPSTDS